MAEAVVGYVAETFGNLLIEEAKFLHGVSDQVEELQLDLDRLRSFLRDAEARQNEGRDIKVWISQTRDLAYEAEDLVEKYAFKIASQRENIFKRTVCFLNECYVRHSIGSEIQKLKSKISGLTRSFQEYGIRTFVTEREGPSSSSEQQLRRTYSNVVEDNFIALYNDVEILVGHLVNENEADCRGVVSIYGMGGLGKTTLARKVYNHPKVQRYFENLAWVCISQQWQTREILQGILIKFSPTQRDEIIKWRDEELIRNLFETVQNKKCLIVLDDIWSADAWECIKEAFPITEKGSKLLLTTRIRGVALHIGPNGFHHEPRLLSDLESWELLQMKALRGRTYMGPEDMHKMEELGKEMVKYCGGLPLAVVVLGGILITKRDMKEWESVLKNVKAYIGRGDNIVQQQGVQKILALSYNDLPLKLKPCFLYFSRFPEDSDIDVEKLYQLWMAEGMISVKDRIGEEPMMDVAQRYLGELAERSMVQVKVDEEVLRMTRFQYCRLHDLMRDLSLEKAKEANFFLSVHSRNGFDDQVYESSSSTQQIHRLVIHFQEEDVPKYVPPRKGITRHLRWLSLLVEDGSYEGRMPRTIKSQFTWFVMLRVLEIEGLEPDSDVDDPKKFCCGIIDHLKLPEAVGNLIHLRYLSLRGSFFIWLPSSLGNLKHLQTLDLRDACIFRVPNVLRKLRRLKYLYLPDLTNDLRNLRGNKLSFNGLDKLEILEGFYGVSCSYKDLLKLTNLRQLVATVGFECDDQVEFLTIISNLKSLYKVTLKVSFFGDYWLTREKCSEILSKLFSCHNLSHLEITSPISNFPNYEACFALDLISLSLENSELTVDPMETLERFPNLQHLHLDGNSFLGTEIQCAATGFPRLRELRLSSLPNLVKWTIAEGSMPNLSSLTILNCSKLEMIPDGLRFINTLKELRIDGMPEEFNARVRVIDGQEGEDFDKIRHVPLVKVR